MYAKDNFYLKPLQKYTPAQWYGYQVLGERSIAKILPEMMAEAGFKGYYTGHSLRRSGGSRLFQAGVQRKIVKECTGHSLDAVDKYQITSNEQKEIVSKILQGTHNVNPRGRTQTSTVTGTTIDNVVEPKLETNDSKPVTVKGKCTTNAPAKAAEIRDSVGLLVEQVMKSLDKGAKAKIKIEVELCKE